MSVQLDNSVKGLKPEVTTVSSLLTDYRQHLERENGAGVEMMQGNAALILFDLCRHLGFKQPLIDRVLGRKAAKFVQDFLNTTVSEVKRH